MSPCPYKKVLGVDYPTASRRLLRQCLLRQLKKYGDNICFKCNLPIDSVEELSLEHKKPWLYVSADLFWDLDNVAFSHRRCNIPDRPWLQAEKVRIYSPEGMSWCSKCQSHLPIEKFGRYKRKWNGINPVCKECNKANARRYYKKKDEHVSPEVLGELS